VVHPQPILTVPSLLLDNSVVARIRVPTVAAALHDLVQSTSLGLSTCLPQRLEIGVSARSAADFARQMALLDLQQQLPITSAVEATAATLQRGLVGRGQHRGPQLADLILAALAIEHRATVVHYDSDYDLLSALDPQLDAVWVVGRGTVA